MLNINRQILMSDAHHFGVNQHINPYYYSPTVDRNKAQQEHHAVHQMLLKAGVKVIQVPSPPDCQDGVYTANWGLVRGDKVVLSNLPSPRAEEQPYAEKVLRQLGKQIIHVPNNLKFSGQGDALACGDWLFCGSGYRSDPEAQSFAAEALNYDIIQLHTVPQLDSSGNQIINKATGWPDSFFYDLDLALAVIKAPDNKQSGLIAYCPDAFDLISKQKLENLPIDKIIVSETEAKKAFATNLVSTGKTVVMGAECPELANNLKSHGLEVLQPSITELAKGGGYIRCITLTLD